MKILKTLHNDLQLVKLLVYDSCNFEFKNYKQNIESKEYSACSFEINDKIIQHRISKITPTKTGQFVTIWKRNNEGTTAPFDLADELDFIIITSRNEDYFGQFIFPKQVLVEKGIMSNDKKLGKRGIRVYPPWDTPNNKQAEKTQKWQINYFLTIENNGCFDLNLAKKLLDLPY